MKTVHTPAAGAAQFCRNMLVLFVVILAAALSAAGAPVRLRCNAQDRPLGIDTAQPTLSWQSDSAEQDWKQTAYRLRVASTAIRALSGQADVWDSGKQDSAASVDIPYRGPALESRRRYFWSVEVWDSKGRTAKPLQAAWWEMGLLKPADWSARWISGTDHGKDDTAGMHWLWLPGQDALHAAPRTTATFLHHLQLSSKPVRATLSVAARGDFTVTVNGVTTGHKRNWTAFDNEDVLPLVHAGSNDLAVVVTTPAAERGTQDGSPASSTVPAGFAALIRLEMPDGSIRRIVTGDPSDQWLVSRDSGAEARPAQVGAELDDPRMGATPGVPAQPASLLRSGFTLRKPVARARLYITAAGTYQATINGRRIAPTELTPGFTDYQKRIAYQTYDVTPMLVPGRNTLGALLGDGWYRSPLLWNGTHAFPGAVRLLAQLEVRYADGSSETIASSPEWKTASSAVLSSSIYAGETYDARLEQRGWDRPAFDVSKWQAATAAAAPEAAITAQIGAPVHLALTLSPKSVRQLANGDAVFDMGQNMVGWARLRVTGPAGTTVKMRFAERLNADGSIYTENLRNAEAEDSYTMRGGGPEVYAPHFTFHGFQYVQVSGLPQKAVVAMLTGEVLNSLIGEPTGRLETSSAQVNRMWNLGVWGQRGNFLSIPTDCPQRDERLGWMGDAGNFWRTGSFNFDIAAFSAKFMQDIVDAQTAAGAYTDVSPNLLGPRPGAPGWGDAGIIVPYTTWLQYGDSHIIEANWASMERWMDFIEKSNPNFLRERELGANYADWLAPDQATSKALVGTAYWAIVAEMMRDMATATGHDPGKYTAVYDHIREAYRKAYVRTDGNVLGDTQTSYVLTLYAGLAPEGMRPAMTDKLVANIKAHDGHLTTGFLGTPFLLFALSDNGRTDAAYDLLLQTTYPSWGYMVSKGATTWWERWNGDSGDPAMNSYNHYSFGSVMAWVYQDAVGIDTSSAHPGFEQIELHPHFSTKLDYAKGEYDSAYGTIVSGWKRLPTGKIGWTVTVPANTSARISLQSGWKLLGGVSTVPSTTDPSTVQVGSGTYRFEAEQKE